MKRKGRYMKRKMHDTEKVHNNKLEAGFIRFGVGTTWAQ